MTGREEQMLEEYIDYIAYHIAVQTALFSPSIEKTYSFTISDYDIAHFLLGRGMEDRLQDKLKTKYEVVALVGDYHLRRYYDREDLFGEGDIEITIIKREEVKFYDRDRAKKERYTF